MSAAVTVTYGGTTVTHEKTAVHVSSTGISPNTLTGYNASNYPASPQVKYYFSAELAGQTSLRSQVFAPDGGHGYWDGVVFPAAGAWSVHLRAAADDSDVASTPVTVV